MDGGHVECETGHVTYSVSWHTVKFGYNTWKHLNCVYIYVTQNNAHCKWISTRKLNLDGENDKFYCKMIIHICFYEHSLLQHWLRRANISSGVEPFHHLIRMRSLTLERLACTHLIPFPCAYIYIFTYLLSWSVERWNEMFCSLSYSCLFY